MIRRRQRAVVRPRAVFTSAEIIQALYDTHPYRFAKFTPDPDDVARNLTLEVDANLTLTIVQEQP